MSRYQDYADKAIASLPTSSVAEFRQQAWSLANKHYAPGVMLDLYWSWCAAGFLVAMIIFGVAGAGFDIRSLWMAGIAAVLLGLLMWRIVGRFKRAAAVRRALIEASHKIDDQAERGDIPKRPDSWTGDIPRPIEHDSINKIQWRRNA